MLKVACVAAIFAVAASRPQGGFGDTGYQFPYSSQSIKLHADDDEEYDYKHYMPDEHHLEVYHPIQDKHEEHDENVDSPQVHEETIDSPFMQQNKYMGAPKKYNEKQHAPSYPTVNHEFAKHQKYPQNNQEKQVEFPKFLHGKLPMSTMMMQHGMPKHNEEEKSHHEAPKKHEEHKNHEHHHEKHEEKHEGKHEEKHEEHHHIENPFQKKYEYNYKVEDPHTGDYKTHHESRHGDVVHGFYAIHEADGTTRIVEYSADQHDGFKATVRHEGQPTHAA